MSKSKKAKDTKAATPAPMRKPVARQAAILLLTAIVGWGGGYALWKATRPAAEGPAATSQIEPGSLASQVEPAAQVEPKKQSTAASDDLSTFQKLKGRWVRLDGGYVVEVSSVDEKGRMEAIYLNPKPIKVAKAEASQDGATTKMHLELRGENYPGSTYDLTYDPQSDQLAGVYYQAALQQRFDVTFVRVAEE